MLRFLPAFGQHLTNNVRAGGNWGPGGNIATLAPLTELRYLDLGGPGSLGVRGDLSALAGLSQLRYLNLCKDLQRHCYSTCLLLCLRIRFLPGMTNVFGPLTALAECLNLGASWTRPDGVEVSGGLKLAGTDVYGDARVLRRLPRLGPRSSDPLWGSDDQDFGIKLQGLDPTWTPTRRVS